MKHVIGTVYRSQDVPEGERFESWRELIDRTRATEARTDHVADFRAEAHFLELGPVTAWRTSFPSSHLWTTARSLRRNDPELCHLSLVLEGELTLVRSRHRSVTVGPLGLLVEDNSRPCEVYAEGAGTTADGRPGLVTGIGVDFPKALLPLPPREVQGLLGRNLPVNDGVGALLADYLTGLDRQAEYLRPSDAPRLGTVLLDLVSALFAHTLEAESALPPETRQEVLARNVRTFIRQNLHDPDLTPGLIASAHHISLSHLHRVFTDQSQGETLAAWVRAQRLERARRDLADPSLGSLPIHAVAARWGMPRASDFTRAFRSAYGLSPREHRLRSLTGRT